MGETLLSQVLDEVRRVSALVKENRSLYAELANQVIRGVGPAMGLCGPCVIEWVRAGSDSQAIVANALVWGMAPGAGTFIPMCIPHFRGTLTPGAQLIAAQVNAQPPVGLIVPGK